MIKMLILQRGDLNRSARESTLETLDIYDFVTANRDSYRTVDVVLFVDNDGTSKTIKDRFSENVNIPFYNVGDIVRPKHPEGTLRSGSSGYTDAVVVSVNPFILVSRDADMMWRHMNKNHFMITEKVDTSTLINCLRRLL